MQATIFKRIAGYSAFSAALTGGAVVNSHRGGVLNERAAEPAPQAIVVRHPLSEPDSHYEFVNNKNATQRSQFDTVGASESEMTMSLEIIKERPDVLNEFLPFDTTANPSLAQRYVNRIVQDQDLMACVAAKLKAESERITLAKLGAAQGDMGATMQWEQVRNLYPCALCQDVLAMPCITNCTHSFCGICLYELRTRCEPCGKMSKNDVTADCPTCRNEITHSAYERIFDDSIVTVVNKIPDCPEKTDWYQRRMDYQKAQDADQNAARPASSNRRRATSYDAAGSTDEDAFDEDWESFKRYIVPALTFAAMVIIAVIRARK